MIWIIVGLVALGIGAFCYAICNAAARADAAMERMMAAQDEQRRADAEFEKWMQARRRAS